MSFKYFKQLMINLVREKVAEREIFLNECLCDILGFLL